MASRVQTLLTWKKLCLVAAALLASGTSARAGLVISVLDTVATPGSSGDTVQVTLTNDSAGSVTISAFSYGLQVNGTDITFTDASATNSAAFPYIFGTNTTGPDGLGTPGSPPSTIIVADSFYPPTMAGPNYATLVAGQTVGLGTVFFDVSPTAQTSAVTVSVIQDPDVTNFANGGGDGHVPIDGYVPGAIAITPSTVATPEPSGLVMIATGLVACAGYTNRRIKWKKDSSGQ